MNWKNTHNNQWNKSTKQSLSTGLLKPGIYEMLHKGEDLTAKVVRQSENERIDFKRNEMIKW